MVVLRTKARLRKIRILLILKQRKLLALLRLPKEKQGWRTKKSTALELFK